jgi:hypothetical protein
VRSIPRKAAVVTMAAVLSVGMSSLAFADGVTDNTAQLSAGINPTLLPQTGNTGKKASLFSQVTNLDNDNTSCVEPDPAPPQTCFPAVPDQEAEEVRIDFPTEMTYKANGKLTKCTNTDAELGVGTDAAAALCADAYIGSGHAFARIAGFPTVNNETELTVLAFNGPASDGLAGFTQAGAPTVILHADNAALPTTVVRGEIRDSVNAGFGQQLNVANAPDVAGGTGALVQFGAQLARGYDNGKTGTKKKKYQLVTSTCDGAGDGDLDFKGTWTYDDTTVDTDTYSQDCTVGSVG